MRRSRNFISETFIVFTLIFATPPARAGEGVGVMVGGEAEIDACGALGEVRGVDPHGDGFLAVRTGPGRKYPIIDRLHNGKQVYFCDQHGEWIGIVYGEPLQDCGVSSPLPQRRPYKGPCHSGWAHRNWLVLIAG